MKVLVINTGSSSIKYQLFNMPSGQVFCSGLLERVGDIKGILTHKTYPGTDKELKHVETKPIRNHSVGMARVAELLVDKEFGIINSANEIDLVGHRVVHGGEKFAKTTEITKDVKEAIKHLSPLAPLHNPANLIGIEVAEQIFAKAKQVAVFDTAFHQSIPEKAFRYAIPSKFYTKNGVRVYGFHGTSHRYITKRAASLLNKPIEEVNLITIHIGNGASMAAIKNGKSIDTTLGLTPLPGLVMGTRSGDIDPGVIFYLNETLGYALKDIKNILNKESGLKGLTNDNDMRVITERVEKGDKEALLALEIYTYRIKKYIGAYLAAIGEKPDAIIFTAGVGENSAVIRLMAVGGLLHLGIELDAELNKKGGGERCISSTNSSIAIWVIPTNEELEIARQAVGIA
ncbi:MAG: acetate kinase [Cyclobacteriaceae bacterium]|nr:acetate kinase [Cyclobacteriaceae bacterium]